MFLKPFISIRKASTSAPSSFFITTPIYYVNANPHIGHLYSSVIADAIYRWHCLLNPAGKFKFSTGTDEHGSKIQQAAHKNKTTPEKYCSNISQKYKDLCNTFNISYTDFIRTSDSKHVQAVHKFWKTLESRGHIHSAKYSGWYCISDECFLPENQLKEIQISGKKILVSCESGHPVEWIEEENYMFPLHKFQNDVKKWLSDNAKSVQPAKFRKILLDGLETAPLPEISVSRPANRVSWGVGVPDDNTQTIYVWLDALVNYLTVGQEAWPADIQVVGKDILKFHAIYWPAFLLAADLAPPKTILCHSHWTVDGEKMSKSKFNVVCPFDRSKLYTTEGLRYFLLREGVAHSDGNYSDTKIIRILNSELADTLGNLLSRCCGSALNPEGVVPEVETSDWLKSNESGKRLVDALALLPDQCCGHYNEFNFYKSVDCVMGVLHLCNSFFEEMKPWELKKDVGKIMELRGVLRLTMETLRICGILLQPVVPLLSSKLLDRLNVGDRGWEECQSLKFIGTRKLSGGNSSGNILFNRINVKEKLIKQIKN